MPVTFDPNLLPKNHSNSNLGQQQQYQDMYGMPKSS